MKQGETIDWEQAIADMNSERMHYQADAFLEGFKVNDQRGFEAIPLLHNAVFSLVMNMKLAAFKMERLESANKEPKIDNRDLRQRITADIVEELPKDSGRYASLIKQLYFTLPPHSRPKREQFVVTAAWLDSFSNEDFYDLTISFFLRRYVQR